MKAIKFILIFSITILLSFLFGCANEKSELKNPANSLLIDSIVEKTINSSYDLSQDQSIQENTIANFKQVISNKNFRQAKDSLQSLCFHRLGCFYYNISEYKLAMSYLDTAIQIRSRVNRTYSDIDLATSYYVRSLVNEELFNLQSAKKDILFAINKIEHYPEEFVLRGKYYTNAGSVYSKLGETSIAESYFQQAKKYLTLETEDLAFYYNNYGRFLQSQSRNSEALISFDKSLAIYKKLPDIEFRSAPVRFNRFDLLLDMKPYEEVYPAYTKYLSSFRDSTLKLKNLKWAGYNNLALENMDNDDLYAAEKNYRESLKLAEELTDGNHSAIVAWAYEGLGDVATAKNEFTKAIDYYHRAVKHLSIGFDTKDVLALPNSELHVIINEEDLERIMGFKAEALEKKYAFTGKVVDLDAAFLTYQRLDELLVDIRQGYKSAMSRYDLVESTIPYYEKATEVALELYEKKKDEKYLLAAYNFASKNKSVVMLDGLQDENAQFVGIPKSVLKEERQLKKNIYDLDGALYDLKQQKNQPAAEINSLTDQRFQKTRAYEDLIKSFEKDYPKYFELKYANNTELDLLAIQEKLPAATAVIEYFVGDENIYIFTFSKNTSLACKVIERPKAFEADCHQYRKIIEKDSMVSIADFSEKSFSLYDLLLKETLDNLKESSELKRLIIVPDDVLMQVSFETFFVQNITGTEAAQWTDELPFLLRDFAVSYSYSNKFIFDNTTNDRVSKTRGEYIGFGLEYDEFTLEAMEKIQPAQDLPELFRGMGKLLFSDDEVLEIAAIMGGRTYVNDKATKGNFLKEAPNANILHLVTHGYLAKDEPLNSGLIFTKESNKDDFILKAADLYSLELEAEMAVLSACHTGSGKVQRGEGVRSLARAFNYAGCPNVTASLWAAPDLSTKEIMVAYYESLKSGLPKDVSLQQAKLYYLDHCKFNIAALPCNWAHLITIGNVEPLEVVLN